MPFSRSGEEHLKTGFSTNTTARALVRASVLAKDPQASPDTVCCALFLRLYGDKYRPKEDGALRQVAGKLVKYKDQTYRRTELVRAMIYTLGYFSRPETSPQPPDAPGQGAQEPE